MRFECLGQVGIQKIRFFLRNDSEVVILVLKRGNDSFVF